MEQSLRWSGVKDLVTKSFQHCHSLENEEKLVESSQLLQSIFCRLKIKSDQLKFCEKLKESNFMDFSQSFLLKSGYEKKFSGNIFEISDAILSLLWNMCDISVDICQQIVDKKIYEVVIKDMQTNRELSPEKLNKAHRSITSKNAKERIHEYLGIINNTLRNYRESRDPFQNSGIIDVLVKLLDVEDEVLKSLSVIALAFAVDPHAKEDQCVIDVSRAILLFCG